MDGDRLETLGFDGVSIAIVGNIGDEYERLKH